MKFARLELGKTQKHIAEMAGINLRTYINYERGERETPVSVVVVYSSLGINSNWLLTGEGEMYRQKVDNEAELLDGILGGGFSEVADAIGTLENNVPADILKDFYKVMDAFPPKLREELLLAAKQYYERNTVESLAREVRELKEQIRELMEKATG